ncbi:MAG: ABC-type transport auxiliary lipoprotein family protein [Tolumonas sp.]
MIELRLFLAGLLLWGLTACSSSNNSPNYYAIALPDTQSSEVAPGLQPVVAVSDIELADYLNSVGIVYQQDDVQLVTANQHRWAEALDKQLTRSLLQNLRQQLPDYQWQTGQIARQTVAQLQVKVRGFHGRADGHAVISGEWTLLTDTQQYSGQFQQQYPLTADGYPALVRELRAGWQQTSQQLAIQLKPLLATAAHHTE